MFAIYLPGLSGYDPRHLARAGLADLLGPADEAAPSFTEFLPGPDGGRGVCAAWDGRPITCGEFDWTKFSPSVWFGVTKGEKPKPDWFARPHMQLGADVVMGDGQAWTIPVARQLPQILELTSDGAKWEGRVAPTYKRFWEEAAKTLDWFVPDDEGNCSVNYQAGADFICLALSINYRVNRQIASWLGLIRSDLFWPVARAVTEFEELLSAGAKKNAGAACAGPPTSAGSAG